MDPSQRNDAQDRWSDIDRLFTELLDLPPEARMDHLVRACGDDFELYEAVLSLLRATEASDGLFEMPSTDALRAALEHVAGGGASPPLTRIGPYRILRELGRGGMGTVYLGERADADFHQRVAIKVLRRGLDTDDVVRRFLVERRILAALAHPNIARLYDGGATSDGRPYFVMEHVKGTAITSYCDARRLTTAARLDLFLAVADAVRYAHANLVIHRDLKPSNILVTADGRVKLLDFGIAKLLGTDDAEAGELTRTGTHLLTPEYASPEQARGDAVTTASDVYQLGLLLLRLLTGHRARRAGAQLSSHAEVLRPSTMVDGDAADERGVTLERLQRQLRGDLDTIVQKALLTDPAMRYASVEALAADVRRHRAGRPVSARPATRRYRLRKFLTRNRWIAPATTAAFGFIAIYVGTVARHARQLERERNEARAQAARAEEVQQFLIDLFQSPDMYTPADPARGPRITVVEALDVGVERLRTHLRDRPRVRVALLDALAQVYENLGLADRALPVRDEALALHRALTGARSLPARKALESRGRLLSALGYSDSARATFERRLALAHAAADRTPAELAEAYLQLAVLHADMRETRRARAYVDTILAIADTAEIPVRPLSETYRVLSTLEEAEGRLDAAEAAARRVYEMRRSAFGDSAPGTLFAQVQLAATLSSQRRIEESRRHFETVLPIISALLGDEHPLTMASLNNLAVLYGNAGDASAAEALHRRLLEARIRVFGERSIEVAMSYQNLGTALARQGRLEAATPIHEQALAIFAETVSEDSYLRALPRLSLADIALRRRRAAEAERYASAAARLLDRVMPGTPIAAVARCRVGRAQLRLAGPRAAEADLRAAGAVLTLDASLPEYRRECLSALAGLYEQTGRPDSAAAVRARIEVAGDPG